jgi:hypothetical protein
MADEKSRKIAIDEVVESAAAGVLRALDARSAASKLSTEIGPGELVKSGFFVDIVIRYGGYPGPIEIFGRQQLGQGGH